MIHYDDQTCVLMLQIKIYYQVAGLRLFPHCDPSLVESVDVEPAKIRILKFEITRMLFWYYPVFATHPFAMIKSKTVIYETHHQPDFISNRIPNSQQEFLIPISLLEYIGLNNTWLARTPHRVFEIGPSVRG